MVEAAREEWEEEEREVVKVEGVRVEEVMEEGALRSSSNIQSQRRGSKPNQSNTAYCH